jgi:hypothetical protein
MLTQEEKKAAKKLAVKKYQNSKKGKETRAKYIKSKKHKILEKIRVRKYQESKKGKERLAKYKKTKKFKSMNKIAQAKYAKTKKGKLVKKKWQQSKAGKIYLKEWKRKLWIRIKKDPAKVMIFRIRQIIPKALKRKNQIKKAHFINLLGCTTDQLRKHIENQFKPGMNWDNYGPKGWHVDHVKAINNFDLSDIKQQKICFNYSNLQPLWADENLKKSSKY